MIRGPLHSPTDAARRPRNGAVLPSARQLLEAMDGIAYLADLDGIVLAIGSRAWTYFARENGTPGLLPELTIGRSLFDTIRGSEVADTYRKLHAAVASRKRTWIHFDYRCDSPEIERNMRMAIGSVTDEDNPERVTAILYQSVILSERARPRISLFDPETWRGSAGGPLVALCSYCQSVGWPPGTSGHEAEWIAPESYYQRGGPAETNVSHGICPACYERVVMENAAA